MKTFKTFGLLATITVFAMALLGSTPAMAENTAMCETDKSPCSSPVSHVHYVDKEIEILTSSIDYRCEALYLADVHELGSSQVLQGAFTYANCNHSCTREEVNGPVILDLLRIGHESAELTGTKGAGVISECPGSLACVYSFENLVGTVTGPLLAKAQNGEIVYDHEPLTSVSGFLCPQTPKLDARFVLSSPAYISS